MKIMLVRKSIFILSGVTSAVLLASCGGGGSSSDTATDTTVSSSTTSTVSGTVPGTLIEAFCADGSYHHVNSTDNGTDEHPFSIDLPNNIDCHLVMTTHEDDVPTRVISPIQINSGLVTSGLINLSSDFALGYIDLPMSRDTVDVDDDGVIDTPFTLSLSLPDGVVLRSVNYDPLDVDGDGIPDAYDDDDDDGIFNSEDEDYHADEDGDGDGIDDLYDRDDDNDGVDDEDSSSITDYTPVTNYSVTTGRLLASQCAQCHGTNGSSTNSWDSIAGESASELVEEMLEIQDGEEDLIMQAQAHGYILSEIEALSAWLATQPESEEDDD